MGITDVRCRRAARTDMGILLVQLVVMQPYASWGHIMDCLSRKTDTVAVQVSARAPNLPRFEVSFGLRTGL